MSDPNTKPHEYPYMARDLWPLAVPVSVPQLDPANARYHPPRNLSTTKASLARYGQRKPIVVNRNGNITEAGNATLLCARELGWTHIAAVFVEDDPVTATGFSITDNRSAELSEWSDATLGSLLSSLEDAGAEMESVGWTQDEIESVLAAAMPVYGEGATEGRRGNNNMDRMRNAEFGKGAFIRCEIGEIMTSIPNELYQQIWTIVSGAESQQAGISRVLEVAVENWDRGCERENEGLSQGEPF